MLSTALLVGALASVSVSATTYPRVDHFQGKTFLDGWAYPKSPYDNTTSGDVFWATAANTSLLYANDAGNFIMKVDNESSVIYNEKRYAPLLTTQKAYKPGTVWVIDAVHMPYGCSVWPAIWTQGPGWPAGGEIDIMEGVNGQTKNQIALHSDTDGCYASSSVAGEMTGSLNLDNCSVTANSGSGCTIGDPNTNSYGADFAAAGGGVYVCEFAEEWIKVWFLTRSAVPASLTADAENLDTDTLGKPVAYYPATTCNIDKFFGDQTLTIDITLCGVWAGAQSTLEQTCPPLQGTNSCYTTYVINDQQETYKNAYFEFSYINVFSSNSTSQSTAGGAAAGSSDSSSTSGTSTGASGSGSSGASTTGAGSSGAKAAVDSSLVRFGGAVVGAVVAGAVMVL